MAKTVLRSVDEYLASQPVEIREVLARVRGALRKALPGAEEGISYGIPAYKLQGRTVIYFAGWKKHYSLYPATGGVKAALGNLPGRYEVEKGTIRFALSERVPVGLIGRIARLRAQEVVAGERRKTVGKDTAGRVREGKGKAGKGIAGKAGRR
jgi:uncharacterized protein YdhG (YjbR/CyaY superfamily)